MHKAVKRALTAEEIQTYRRDGVVLVRELIDPDWVTELQGLVDQNIVQPSTMVRDINESGGTGNFFGDTFVCHHIAGFRSFIFNSPCQIRLSLTGVMFCIPNRFPSCTLLPISGCASNGRW